MPTDDVALGTRGLTSSGLIENVSISVHRGEVVGLFGLMGAGRTELARVLYGLEACWDSGTVWLDGRDIASALTRDRIARGLSFVTEDRRGEGLFMDYSVVTNAALPSLRRFAANLLAPLRWRTMRESVAHATQELRLKAGDIDRAPVRNLSGGNQQKVVLAKWLGTGPRYSCSTSPPGVSTSAPNSKSTHDPRRGRRWPRHHRHLLGIA